MDDINYNLQFAKLCKVLNLGEIVGEPKGISGGLLHRMYAIETTEGKYAIKALNPRIMLRPVAMKHMICSEQIADIASKNIPALTAKKFNGTSIQKIENQFYLVFDWAEGKSLKQNEINIVHCEKIGAILGAIHRTNFSKLGLTNDWTSNAKLMDWSYYLNKGQENNTEWVNLLRENIDKLHDWNAQVNEAAKLLAANMVISHRDLDSKNVMWNQNNPLIIDWEAAGYVNPMQELIETAIYWSEKENGAIDKERFLAFISSYKKKYGEVQADWEAVLSSGFTGKLGWLEYNLKRALKIECTDESEQQMGNAQVIGTINDLKRYANMMFELKKWLSK